MAELEGTIVMRMQEAGVFGNAAADEIEFLQGEIELIDRVGLLKVDVELDKLDPFGEEEPLYDMVIVAEQIDPAILPLEHDDFRALKDVGRRTFWTQARNVMQDRIKRLGNGERLPRFDSLEYRHDPDNHLFERWRELQDLTARFEAMLQKQLREAD